MNDSKRQNNVLATARRVDSRVEQLAAEFSAAAYSFVLRRRPKGSWLDVELALWREVGRAFEAWARARSGAAISMGDGPEALLTGLTEGACSVAVEHGVEGTLPELRSGLNGAFRSVMQRDERWYDRVGVDR